MAPSVFQDKRKVLKNPEYKTYIQSEPCERLLGTPQKIQMGPFNISKHLGRCVLFRSNCKLAP